MFTQSQFPAACVVVSESAVRPSDGHSRPTPSHARVSSPHLRSRPFILDRVRPANLLFRGGTVAARDRLSQSAGPTRIPQADRLGSGSRAGGRLPPRSSRTRGSAAPALRASVRGRPCVFKDGGSGTVRRGGEDELGHIPRDHGEVRGRERLSGAGGAAGARWDHDPVLARQCGCRLNDVLAGVSRAARSG